MGHCSSKNRVAQSVNNPQNEEQVEMLDQEKRRSTTSEASGKQSNLQLNLSNSIESTKDQRTETLHNHDRTLVQPQNSTASQNKNNMLASPAGENIANSPVSFESRAPALTHQTSSQSPTQSNTPHSSRLEDTQRRRLSVSTVSCEEEDSDSSIVARKQPHNLVGRIQKYADPALELVNESTGTIREVSCEMLMNLLQETISSLLLFGAPCDYSQRGFDNKKQEILGSRGSSVPLLLSSGIGYACKKGLKPESPNQDDFFVMQVDDWSMYGVFDGHGPYGHEVSNFVHKALPFLILSDSLFETEPLTVLKRSFKKTHHLLEALSESSDAGIDCTLSGTTATIIIHRKKKLYIAHVGDSRGVLALKSGKYVRATDLTTDHKPTREDEKMRIEASGGEVRRLEGDIPHRVFVKNRLYPGLAMSRALGDTVGAAVGVIPEPDVKVIDLTADVQFIIVATDGVWEFISSQEAVDFVCQKKRQDVQSAAEFLAYESWRRWVEEEENVVDDVTCLIIWTD